MSRLKEQYENEIVPALKKKFEYKNPMEARKDRRQYGCR